MVNRDDIPPGPWAIIGCGYTGTRLARRLLHAGETVHATRRTAAGVDALRAAAPGITARALDLDALADHSQEQAARAIAEWLPADALLIHSAPPSTGSPATERALVHAAHLRHARRVVYISSTAMYPACAGEWIDEDCPPAPRSDRGHRRLAAESALLQHARQLGISAVALRAVGIYGPGRGVHARLHANRYRIIGAGDSYVNRVHVDDLGTAILAAARAPTLPHTIYHVADNQPERSREYADQVAAIMGLPPAPSVPESEVEPWVVAMLGSNRRVSNRRLRDELGVTLAYPTWREGLAQVLVEDDIAVPAGAPPNPGA